MRTFRFALLASAAAVLAACSDDVTAPAGPTIAGSPQPVMSPFFTAAPAESDSVIAGYGCESTGGIDYECFEYDPDCGTEYVVCSDTTTPPPPPPPPPPAPAPAPQPTSPGAAEDSVSWSYGGGSTGGIEYEAFEYEPETGTEPVVAFDGKGNDAP